MTTDKLTAETITDDQIQTLRATLSVDGRPTEPLPTDIAYRARRRVADAINAINATAEGK